MIVPDEYFEMFRDICEDNNIQICIDLTSRDTIYGGIPVAFSAEHNTKAYAILKSTMKSFEDYHAPKNQLEISNRPEIREPLLKSNNYEIEDSLDRE